MMFILSIFILTAVGLPLSALDTTLMTVSNGISLPVMTGYTPPPSNFSTFLSDPHTVNGTTAKTVKNDVGLVLYSYEFENGTVHYSPSDPEQLVDQGIFNKTMGLKCDWSSIAAGVIIYFFTYGVLRVTGRHTNIGVARKAANLMREVVYGMASLLNSFFIVLRWVYDRSGAHMGDRRHILTAYDIANGDAGELGEKT